MLRTCVIHIVAGYERTTAVSALDESRDLVMAVVMTRVEKLFTRVEISEKIVQILKDVGWGSLFALTLRLRQDCTRRFGQTDQYDA